MHTQPTHENIPPNLSLPAFSWADIIPNLHHHLVPETGPLDTLSQPDFEYRLCPFS
jgi:hypothetical protein